MKNIYDFFLCLILRVKAQQIRIQDLTKTPRDRIQPKKIPVPDWKNPRILILSDNTKHFSPAYTFTYK